MCYRGILWKLLGYLSLRKCIYNNPTILMVYWWVRDSYFNNAQIQMSHVELLNAAYGS